MLPTKRIRSVLVIVLSAFTIVAFGSKVSVQGPAGRGLRVQPVVTNLDTVWGMIWSPDGEMWITERPGRVSRIDIRTNRRTDVGRIPVHEQGESGLMGMAIHPDFPRQPWLYFAYSFPSQSGIGNRLVRTRYENGNLGPSETLVDNIGGRQIHNGSRLVIGPDRMLYMTMGDAGQMSTAQDKSSLNGKVLRLTLEGKPAPGNPFNNEVWSWGHRNPQGLAFDPGTGALFSTEHGPDSDDEINIIEKGRNYGWPAVRGFCNRPDEALFCKANDVVEPLQAWTPTVGISGAAFYDKDLIPGWKGSLIAASLTGRSLFRLVLSPDRKRIVRAERLFENEYGRLRDVLIGADGTVYLATSNQDGRARGVGPFEGDDKILRITP